MTRKTIRDRSFPFVPKSSRDLEIGDFWAVRLEGGRFGCAVVTDLKRSGVASRKYLVAGLVDWVGNAPPTLSDASHPIFDQGLTGITTIAVTGQSILGNVSLPSDFQVGPNFRDYSVGTVHSVWGQNTLARLIEGHLAGRS